MTTLFRAVVALFSALLVAGCMGSNEPVTRNDGPALKEMYSLSAVKVTMAPNARYSNVPPLTDEQKKEVADNLPVHMESAIRTKVAPEFKGKAKARMDVSIHSVYVPTGVGRTIGQYSSATVSLKVTDARNGKVVREQVITATDKVFRGEGLFLPVMIAVNAGSTKEQRYQELADEFVDELILAASN